MHICNSSTIREWDLYTIAHEPIRSIDLMERAANSCADWIARKFPAPIPFTIFCGPGNNGGDGLALARILSQSGRIVDIYLLDGPSTPSPDNLLNQGRCKSMGKSIHHITSETDLPTQLNSCIIDALFGTGLSRPLDGLAVKLVDLINLTNSVVVSIDIPSGLSTDRHTDSRCIISADHTLSFQCLKPAFLVAENERYTGNVQVQDIGLSPSFPGLKSPEFHWTDKAALLPKLRIRHAFDHKGTRGHAALLAGSWGMLGAAILAARACLRSGCGKLTCFTDSESYPILQTNIPEAIFSIHDDLESTLEDLDHHAYDALGAGPGWGKKIEHSSVLKKIFSQDIPLVLDADALNFIAGDPSLLNLIPAGTVITPHPLEFERLFGKASDDFERIRMARHSAIELQLNILLKGHRSCLFTPKGTIHVNSSGNPGMATSGSGDVLTGIITGLLAQGYPPEDATMLGAWLHGCAGDLYARDHGEDSLIAGDLPSYLGQAFLELHG